jgi:hypothetical protein
VTLIFEDFSDRREKYLFIDWLIRGNYLCFIGNKEHIKYIDWSYIRVNKLHLVASGGGEGGRGRRPRANSLGGRGEQQSFVCITYIIYVATRLHLYKGLYPVRLCSVRFYPGIQALEALVVSLITMCYHKDPLEITLFWKRTFYYLIKTVSCPHYVWLAILMPLHLV